MLVKDPLDYDVDRSRKPRKWLPAESPQALLSAQAFDAITLRSDCNGLFSVLVYVVDQPHGWIRWNTDPTRIGIPLWIWDSDSRKSVYGKRVSLMGSLFYYIAHELAHFYADPGANHGPEFMREFKRLCPEELWWLETTYKPRNAKAAGISA